MTGFGPALRHWRKQRRISQLELALRCDISARHVSFLETARARPSRDMVLRLAEALDISRTARNDLLTTAGFAAHFPSLSLDDQQMAPVRAAMDRLITGHLPFPALIMDRLWRVQACNAVAAQMIDALDLGAQNSLLEVLIRPGALQSAIENWAEVGHHTMRRLRGESACAGGIAELDQAADALAAQPEIAGFCSLPGQAFVPTIYRFGPQRLSLFSTYAQFGTAEDVVLADMKIELMFPGDTATQAVLKQLHAAQTHQNLPQPDMADTGTDPIQA